MSARKNLVGKHFGRLRVVSFDGVVSGCGYWNCVCVCTKRTTVPSAELLRGHTQSCGCKQRDVVTKVGSAFRRVLHRYITDARRGGRRFALSINRFYQLTQLPCYFCGVPPFAVHVSYAGEEFRYNGIDRLVNSKGYTKSNCVPCCSNCNRAKRCLSEDLFIELCKRVARRHS